jgi:Lrp/AsnC family leucine-responsive transcriptional regulator
MDKIDRKIIGLLAADSRRSLADIGGAVGLAPSSVNERIRRLSDGRAIKRFTVEVDAVAIGTPITAFIWIEVRQDEDGFRRDAAAHPDIAECHHVTGAWSYLLKVRVESISGIEGFLTELKSQGRIGRTETFLALSTIKDSVIPPPLDGDD